MKLANEVVDAVGYFVKFLYTGEYFARRTPGQRHLKSDPAIPKADDSGDQLLKHARVYALAEKFGLEKLATPTSLLFTSPSRLPAPKLYMLQVPPALHPQRLTKPHPPKDLLQHAQPYPSRRPVRPKLCAREGRPPSSEVTSTDTTSGTSREAIPEPLHPAHENHTAAEPPPPDEEAPFCKAGAPGGAADRQRRRLGKRRHPGVV
ncbi:hypothetical protein GE09DRAFT_1272401 [Coniochaeta sp. 2T2.1]|nr:hypothetical protein GE09DRAFT_1272401 [Coniochaeta sp. 2T2.1]